LDGGGVDKSSPSVESALLVGADSALDSVGNDIDDKTGSDDDGVEAEASVTNEMLLMGSVSVTVKIMQNAG
jgi:hypothetical protein